MTSWWQLESYRKKEPENSGLGKSWLGRHIKFLTILYTWGNLKSVNLQYNTLVRWADGTNESSTKHLMFQVLFLFHKILQNSLQKPFQLIFWFFYKITKMKIKSFECPKSIRNYEKKNTWNVRHLVNQSFVPSARRTSVLYCRLSDFK